jgi:hypothetical protein
MKPNQEFESDHSLNKALSAWVVDAPLPPSFQEQVWQRIRRAESKSAKPFIISFARLLDAILPRPKLAYSYAMILLVLGIAAGAWAAQAQNTRIESSLGSRYLQSIDPFQSSRDR